ncbi:ribosome maturation factor RimM [Euzebya rosea]|uniref:ribosome maturation factor RimM n=1 Tax=Euzebya rosea TaxID=2052804 RepID=UPI000D3EAF8C|nr:ribosome maturation factor RimM [Euzebya rosea]
MTEHSDPRVVVGRIGKPFGLGGQVYVFTDPDLEDSIEEGATYLAEGHGSLEVVAVRTQKGRTVVAFAGVDSREDAEALRGTILTVESDRVELGEDMIWVADLKGRQVIDDNGDLVGVVETVIDGHAHDYLVVARPDGGSVQLPMVEALLDWAADPIVVSPIPGLLDPDEAW